MFRKLFLGLLPLAALAACDKPLTAPGNPGVCWRMVEGMNGKPDFRPVAPGIDTLENCAARLEAIRMASGAPISGAFQGRFIYVDDQAISAASGLKAQRYRVFTPEQRIKVQQGIQALIDRERAGG